MPPTPFRRSRTHRSFRVHSLRAGRAPGPVQRLLTRGSARLIVTEPRGGGAVADWLAAHGDGVRDIALERPEPDRVTAHARVGGVGALQHTLLRTQLDTDLPPGFDCQPLVSLDGACSSNRNPGR